MKNKKAWIIGTAMGLSTVMLATVAFAGTGATSGYDALKALMRTHGTVQEKNATVDLAVSVTESGKTVVNVDAVMKMDAEAQQMSGVVTAAGSGVDRTMTVYHTGSTGYLNVSGSDTWFQMERTDETGMNGRMGPARGMHGGMGSGMQSEMRTDMAMDPDAAKFGEAFLDAVMGDLKNAVVLTENGTEKTFSLKIDQSNMPELMKAALAIGASHHQPEADAATGLSDEALAELGNPVAEAQLKALIPEMESLHEAIDLKDNVTVDSIDLSFTVDADNQPVSGKTTVIVSGNAADGTAHTYTTDITVQYSNIGSTIPDTFQPEGKDVQVVQMPNHGDME